MNRRARRVHTLLVPRHPDEDAEVKVGVRGLRPHDLRHTYPSRLTMSGVNKQTVQELMGRKDIRMARRYIPI